MAFKREKDCHLGYSFDASRKRELREINWSWLIFLICHAHLGFQLWDRFWIKILSFLSCCSSLVSENLLQNYGNTLRFVIWQTTFWIQTLHCVRHVINLIVTVVKYLSECFLPIWVSVLHCVIFSGRWTFCLFVLSKFS